jgi:hypothetical protein
VCIAIRGGSERGNLTVINMKEKGRGINLENVYVRNG